jgi:hypothetical protein
LQSVDNNIIANNCLTLIKTIKDPEEIESIRDLAVGLLKSFNTGNHEEEICEISNIFGWI